MSPTEVSAVQSGVSSQCSALENGDNNPAGSEIASLQRFLQEKPRNGRALAKLACLLAEQAKKQTEQQQMMMTVLQQQSSKKPYNPYHDHPLYQHALELAERSVQVAPHQPYGSTALSLLLSTHPERMQALRQAIHIMAEEDGDDNDKDNDHERNKRKRKWMIPRVTLLVRLLTEPRQEEKRTVLGAVGAASSNHPSRRALDTSEEALYQHIQDCLNRAWSVLDAEMKNTIDTTATATTTTIGMNTTLSDGDDDQQHRSPQHYHYHQQDQQQLAQQEYLLGLFFRKRMPAQTYQPRARQHFQQASNHLPDVTLQPSENTNTTTRVSTRVMAHFWLSTLPPPPPPQQQQQHQQQPPQSPSATTEATTGKMILDKCPREYIINLYSTFADRFDHLMVTQLHYQTPRVLRALLNESLASLSSSSSRPRFRRVADLGCGTGLSGLAFADLVRRSTSPPFNHNSNPENGDHTQLQQQQQQQQEEEANGGYLIGVDLSPEMIAKARKRGCYDALVVGDVLDILPTKQSRFISTNQHDDPNDHPNYHYDLVVACDVFVYLGDLKTVLERIYQSLRPMDGIVAFSTELLLAEDDSLPPYRLHECARFAHKQSYIETLAMKVIGFELIASKVCPCIRKNQGQDVIGLLSIYRAPTTASGNDQTGIDNA